MNMEDFEAQYRYAIDEILNQLQAINLLLAQADIQISQVKSTVQSLNQTVETFISEQRVEES